MKMHARAAQRAPQEARKVVSFEKMLVNRESLQHDYIVYSDETHIA